MARVIPWFKVLAATVLVAVLGAGAALVAVKAFLPEDKLKTMAVDAARKQLGREVRLRGVSVGLTGVHLSGLEISERPDFAAGTFLSVETFSLRPSWRALLRKKLVVQAASADGLKVRVIKDAAGAFNYETLASSAPATPAPASASVSKDAPPAEFNIRHLRVSRGEIDYRDDAAKDAVAVTGLSLSLDDFSLAEPFDLDVSLRAKGTAAGHPVDAALSFAGTIHPARGDRAKFAAEFKRLSVEQDGLKLSAKGRVAGLDAIDAKLDATLSASGKTVLTADGTVKLSAPGEGGGRSADGDFKLKTSGLDTTTIAKWLPSSGIPSLAIPAMEASLNGRLDGKHADIKSFKVSWKGGVVEGSGAAGGIGTEKAAYQGQARFGVDLPEIRPGEYSFIKLPPKSFVPAMRLDGEASYLGDDLSFKALTAKFKQGTVSVTGAVRKLGSAKPVPDLSLRFAIDMPSFKIGELPFAVTALPADFVVPAMRLDGGAKARGDDVALDKVVIKGKSGTLRLDGTVAKALAGTPVPELEVGADLDLPALTDKDLPPLAAIPAGLELPASKWDADLTYTTKLIKLRRLGVKIGTNELAVSGGVTDPAGRGAFDLLLKCKHFALAELTRMTPRTRDLKLEGAGFFALSVTGNKEKPVYGGKLQFEGLGATVAELPLQDFKGTVSFDERRIDAGNIKGKVGDGALSLDLTVKEYNTVPEIQVDGTLDRFDLGRYFAAKKAVEAQAASAKAAKAAKTGAPVEEKPAAPYRTRGKFNIGELLYPNVRLEKVATTWDLWGVTPDMKRLSGEATFDVAGGNLRDLESMALKSPVVRVLAAPILVFQKLSFGANLNNLVDLVVSGNYAFKDGLMTLRKSEVDARGAHVTATGTVDLPPEKLALVVTAKIGNLMPIDVDVNGTIDKPEAKAHTARFIGESAKQLFKILAPPR